MTDKPHIVIFNPDQWRGDALGHRGHPAVKTPVLDKLVEEEAVSFTQAFCQNPVCTPSRCSFMTGWYPHVRGHRTMFHMLHSDRDEPMLLNILRKEGYQTFWGGKNDVVPPIDGFEAFADVKPDLQKYDLQPNWHGAVYEEARGELGSDTYYSFYIGEMKKEEGEKYYRDTDWANIQEAIETIRNRPKDKPLCLFLPLNNPHPPYGVEEPFFSSVDRSKLPERARLNDQSAKPEIIKELQRQYGMQNWSEQRWDELRATYLGMCERSDAMLGELMRVMREEGIWDNTALFFFADHGDFTGDYDLPEKTTNTFEDSITRVPFIIKPPKSVDCLPGIRDALVELVDFSETVYDLLGIDPSYDRFGKTLLPIIAGDEREHRDVVFCEGGRLMGEEQATEGYSTVQAGRTEGHPYWPRVKLQMSNENIWHGKGTMCRTSRYKYVKRLYEDDEFYDLEKDPLECMNRIHDSSYVNEIAQLQMRLLTWYQETCDVVPHHIDAR